MLNRRSFAKVAMAGAAVSITACASSQKWANNGKKTVVVIGGGSGGATAAKYIKKYAKTANVILVEKNKTYHTCYFGNNVISGVSDISSIQHNYDSLEKNHNIHMVYAMAKRVDAKNKKVILSDGETIAYDKVVVAPGIDFKWDSIPGHSKKAAKNIPHAYIAGEQTEILRDQLANMKQGGTFVLIPPTNPFRCPPGPYERASLVAHYLKNNNPTAKLIILDQKDKFSKFGLFRQGWKREYADIIDWRAKSKGGQVKHIDTDTKTIKTVSGDTIKADVINLIPAQKAGKLAFDSGLTKGDWCPINTMTFESKIHKDVYVIGDASIAAQMPKSGFSANSQAKILAMQLARSLENKAEMSNTILANTCYSFISPTYAISVTAAYKGTTEKIKKTSGGSSPMNADASERKALANTARNWYAGITSDMFN